MSCSFTEILFILLSSSLKTASCRVSTADNPVSSTDTAFNFNQTNLFKPWLAHQRFDHIDGEYRLFGSLVPPAQDLCFFFIGCPPNGVVTPLAVESPLTVNTLIGSSSTVSVSLLLDWSCFTACRCFFLGCSWLCFIFQRFHNSYPLLVSLYFFYKLAKCVLSFHNGDMSAPLPSIHMGDDPAFHGAPFFYPALLLHCALLIQPPAVVHILQLAPLIQ